MSEKRNLGRGLGDMMEEVSQVKAVPSQPVVVEERASDSEINRHQPEVRVEEKIVKKPYMPLWTKLAVAVLAGIVAVLVTTLVQMQNNVKSMATDLRHANEALNADPLAWTGNLHREGARVDRADKLAVIVFDAPFFASDVKWTPASDQILRDLLVQIAPHAGDCFLTIVGHTAKQPVLPGSPYKDNYDLGLKRAEAVMDAMIRIVKWPVTGVSARSDGEKYPPYRGDDPLSQIRNRTITIEIRTR